MERAAGGSDASRKAAVGMSASAIRPCNPVESNHLVDDTITRYVEWREECEAVSRSYRVWSSAIGSDPALRYAAYCSAVDREERAAELYAATALRLTRTFWSTSK